MRKLYQRSELAFSLVCIGIHSILQSAAIAVNARLGIEYSASALFTFAMSVCLLIFLKEKRLRDYYNLHLPTISPKRMLYYAPLLLLSSINLWNGFRINLPAADSSCYLIYMFCVAFVEEILFRGFLFRALAKDNVKMAVIVSSLTFGLGHLLNLFNGSGMTLIANLCQVVGAIAVGFLFVVITYRTDSIIPCIVTHAAIDMVSLFANENGLTAEKRFFFGVVRILIVCLYLLVIDRNVPNPAAGRNQDVR